MTLRPLIVAITATIATTSAHAQQHTGSEILTSVGPDVWHASKLPGVGIFGPDHKRVGAVKDLLVGRDGMVKYVVVGIGGFAGVGQKSVAIPFSQVKFTDRAGARQGETAPIPNTADAAQTVGAAQSSLGDDVTGSIAPKSEAALTAPEPDHGTIDLTGDQLKAAPDFRSATP